MKNILIILDSHPSEKKIIETGFNMAKEMKASIMLLNVKIELVNYNLMYKKMGNTKPFNLENFEVATSKFLEISKHNQMDAITQFFVKQGYFAESVLNTANEMKIDIIIMGSHNTIWLEEMVIGRVTQDELQQTEIPIMIIPTRKHDTINTTISLEK